MERSRGNAGCLVTPWDRDRAADSKKADAGAPCGRQGDGQSQPPPDSPALGLEDSPGVSTSPAMGAWPRNLPEDAARKPRSPSLPGGCAEPGASRSIRIPGEGFVCYGCHGRLGWETAARQETGIRAWATDVSHTHHLQWWIGRSS
ncbi:unnamed protein product [Rangifer tarandus platyrhynchus]|uniref:Uncharacterized protein n=1 Tax=Rangifer tarandus platyrhynchus TaxID=3082113 RepID=A0ABN8Y4W8_RANTA|nr:unnamed protein product [Rangifer tarandus platyrhynchus]